MERHGRSLAADRPTRYTFKGDLDTTFGTLGRVVTDFGGDDRAEAVALQSDGRIVVVGRSDGDFALARYGTNGALDATFDADGLVTTDFGGTDPEGAFGVVIQASSKIVAAGGASDDFAIARYESDGSPDSTFGTNGKLTTDFTGSDVGEALVPMADGKLVVVGSTSVGDDFALARYEGDFVPGVPGTVPAGPP